LSTVTEFAASIPGFYRKTAVDQIILLAWYAETREQRASFDGAYMRRCFSEVSAAAPNMSLYLPRMAAKRPPQLVRVKDGYRLAPEIRRTLDTRHGGEPTSLAVARALTDLPARLPDLAEREFLTETLNCYRVRAFRAAIVMAWNLAYDHLVRWVLHDPQRLQAFNAGIVSKYPKKNLTVFKREDLETLKESEFVEVARTANLTDKNTTQILRDKLNRRNMAAHPSCVVITQHQADDMITDLVENVILRIG
jgi:hypothetical protein